MAEAERGKDGGQDEQRRQHDQQGELQVVQRVGQLADGKGRVRVPEKMLDQQGDRDRGRPHRRQDDVLLDGRVGAVIEVEAGGAQQEHGHEEHQAGHE